MGKEIELLEEYEKAEIKILALCETKRGGGDVQIQEKRNMVIWSGVQQEKEEQQD